MLPQPVESQGAAPSPVALSRLLTINLSYRSFTISVEAHLSRGDPRAIEVVGGGTSLTTWFQRTFGSVSVGDFPVEYLFSSVPPQLTISPTQVLIKATSDSVREPLGQKLAVKFTDFTGNTVHPFPSPFENDQVSLSVRDYSVLSLEPIPTEYASHVVSWSGTQLSREVDIGLSYSGPGRLLDILQSQPDFWLPDPWRGIFSLVVALYVALPAIVVAWIAIRVRSEVQPVSARATATVEQVATVWAAVAIAYGVDGFASWLAAYIPAGENLTPFDFYRMLYGETIALAGAIGLVVWALFLVLRLTFRRRTLHEYIAVVTRSVAAGALLAVVIDSAGLVGASVAPNYQWRTVAYVEAVLVVAGLVSYTAATIWRTGWPGRRMAIGSSRLLLLVVGTVAVVGIAIPWPGGAVVYADMPTIDLFRSAIRDIMGTLETLVRVAAFLGAFVLLRQDVPSTPASAFILLVAAFAVGMFPIVLGVPLVFLVGLALARFLLQPAARRQTIAAVRDRVLAERAGRWLPAALDQARARNLKHMNQESINKKATSGDLSPSEYDTQSREWDDYLAIRETQAEVPPGVPASDVVLMFGPEPTRWTNGWYGLLFGLAIASPLVVFNFIVYGFDFVAVLKFPIAYLVVDLASITLVWAASGFFFGYFLEDVKFRSGLSKGVLVGLIVALAQLPGWVVGFSSVAETTLTVLRTAFTIFFFSAIGLIFDYRTWRLAYDRARARQAMSDFAGFQPAATALTVALPSLGLTILTALSGQLGQLLNLVQRILPPSTPPPH